MKGKTVKLVAFAIVVSLLAVSLPLTFSDADSASQNGNNPVGGDYDLQVAAGSDNIAYLLEPVSNGASTIIKISSDAITTELSSADSPIVEAQNIKVAGSLNTSQNVLSIVPADDKSGVLVTMDLTQPVYYTWRTTQYNVNDYVSSFSFIVKSNAQSGGLNVTVWFMTDAFSMGVLDFSGSNVPEITLDPAKTYADSPLLVKGLSAGATASLPDGMSMTYQAYDNNYSSNRSTVEQNFGYRYNLTVTDFSSGDASFTDGGATYPFRIALVEHDQYDTLVIGTAQNPNVMTDLILDSININYVFKYSNPELSTIPKDVISKRLLHDDDTFDDKGYCLTISESEDDDSILIAVNGTLSTNHLYRICLTLGTDESSYSFKVMFATDRYYRAVINSPSETSAAVEINADKQSCDYMLIKGVGSDSVVNYDIPGVVITAVKEDKTIYGDLLYLKIATDKTKTANETYSVTVGSGERSVEFSMAVHTFVCLNDVNGYDYEIYSLMRGNAANISWNLGEKNSLLFKVHLPDASSDDLLLSGSYMLNPYATIGYQWDQVEFEVREYSPEQRYAIFSVTALEDKAMHDGAYMITIGDGGNSAKLINVAVTNHVDVTVSFVSGAATLEDSWDVVSNERLTVRLDGMSEGKTDIIKAKLYKDGTEISDYSGMLSISCRCYDDGHASLMMIALDGIQEGSYKVSLPLANDDVYELTFSTIKGAVPPSPSGTAYSLEHQVEIRGSNVRLTLDIEKTSGEELGDARLLVIAKYQGGIVVNFYSKPLLVNGNGTDVIEVSQQNLVQVVVEMVDGFQSGNPVHYGWVSYDV